MCLAFEYLGVSVGLSDYLRVASLNPRADIVSFLGFLEIERPTVYLTLRAMTVFDSRDVVFKEDSFPFCRDS